MRPPRAAKDSSFYGGGGGIRTHGPGLPDCGFQDRHVQPLRHTPTDQYRVVSWLLRWISA